MPQQQPPLILVDGSSYLYRAFHAMPPLTSPSGDPTGAVYGVVNMIKKLLQEYKPKQMAVVFDAKGKTFRDDMYEEYKANRPSMPDDLRPQVEPIHQIIAAMGIPVVVISGVEADDVIGSLAQEAANQGVQTLISTGDKDMAQLVNDKVTLLNTMTDTSMDIDGVKAKFGVTPEQIIDYLALMGDKSDNVPGVESVGPKTAVKWLEQHGTVEEVIANADQVKGKVGEKLRAGIEMLKLSKQLVTIKLDVGTEDGLDRDVSKLGLQLPDNAALKDLYTRMGFSTWLKQVTNLEAAAGKSAAAQDTGDSSVAEGSAAVIDAVSLATPIDIAKNYETIFTMEQLQSWVKKLEGAELVSFDLETTSVDYMEAQIVGFSFSVKEGEAAYLPVAHDYPGAPEQIELDVALKELRPVLEDTKVAKVGHHMKYDMNVLSNYGVTLANVEFDSMMESYVFNSTATRHDMDSVAAKYLGYETIHYEDVAGKGAKQIGFNQVAIEDASPYAAEDADISLRIHNHLFPQLQEQPKPLSVLKDMEMRLVPILSRIECTGVLIDCNMLAVQSRELAEKMLEIEKKAHECAGQPFNLASPKQLQEILFEQQGLPVIKKTPKGVPSTAEAVLIELAQDYELPALLLEHRSMSKLKSTYTDKLPLQINRKTNRVHTSYHQAVTATGRLSSSNPNLQNIPIRSEEGRRVRQAFIAEPGKKIVAADYSQVELRIMADISQDEGLLHAFNNGIDIHRATAAEITATDLQDVTSEQRRRAKAVNFGLIYGMSAFGLAKQLDISRGEAQDYVNLYFDRYPKVKEYMEETKVSAKETGYVETLLGRRLYIDDINSRNGQRRQYAERSAINAPMQGTAADIIKIAMISIGEYLADQNDIKMIMQVHDELVFEVPEAKVEEFTAKAKELMESAAELSVPLIVDIGVGDNWDEAH